MLVEICAKAFLILDVGQVSHSHHLPLDPRSTPHLSSPSGIKYTNSPETEIHPTFTDTPEDWTSSPRSPDTGAAPLKRFASLGVFMNTSQVLSSLVHTHKRELCQKARLVQLTLWQRTLGSSAARVVPNSLRLIVPGRNRLTHPVTDDGTPRWRCKRPEYVTGESSSP